MDEMDGGCIRGYELLCLVFSLLFFGLAGFASLLVDLGRR